MKKVILNKCFGGFDVSPKAHQLYAIYKGYSCSLGASNREDDILIKVVEELGNEASGRFSELVVVQIPDDLDYVIDDYDGIETLHARVETW